MTFDEYTSSLEFVTHLHESREQRIAAAWEAGYRSTHEDSRPAPELDTGGYLYDRLADAYDRGAATW